MPALSRFPGVALITGAGGTGIGAAVACAFARAGCLRFAITDQNAATLQKTKDDIRAIQPGAVVLAADGDVAADGFAAAFVGDAVAQHGRIDYAVLCAGIAGAAQRSHELPVAEFDRINGVNYRGAWLSARAALGQMVGQPLDGSTARGCRGAIVHVASQLGLVARADAPAYCGSKAAVVNLTRADAIDYARDAIRVNCVCPGVIATPMTTSSPELIERLRPAVATAPLGRMGTPDEVADAVLFLCSPQASFIQGHALVVDGGYTIN